MIWNLRKLYWRLRWLFTAREWNKLIHALHGNQHCDVDVHTDMDVVVWNVRDLSCRGAHKVLGSDMSPSAKKLRWIAQEIALHRPMIIA